MDSAALMQASNIMVVIISDQTDRAQLQGLTRVKAHIHLACECQRLHLYNVLAADQLPDQHTV